jgi:hypothetical protein
MYCFVSVAAVVMGTLLNVSVYVRYLPSCAVRFIACPYTTERSVIYSSSPSSLLGDPTEDFLGKFSCTGVVWHCLLLNSLHICVFSVPGLFFSTSVRHFFFFFTASLTRGRPGAWETDLVHFIINRNMN